MGSENLTTKTFFAEKTSKTGNLDANLKIWQYKQDLMSQFVEIKTINSNLTSKSIAIKLGYSDSTKNDMELI